MIYTLTAAAPDSFAVPKQLCSHLDEADPLAVRALLLLLCETRIDAGVLAERLHSDPKTVAAALDTWVDCGLLSRCGGKFTFAAPTAPAAPAMPAVRRDVLPLATASETADILAANESYRFLIEQTANLQGRLLSQNEISTLLSILQYTGMGADILMMIIDYCHEIEKDNLRYIKKVAMDWAERDILTHEQADAEIRRLQTRYTAEGTVRRVFGIAGRSLADAEKTRADKWVNEFGYDEVMLTEAYSACVLNTGKLSFSYIDAVLTRWHEAGVTNPKQIPAEGKDKEKKTAAPGRRKAAPGITNGDFSADESDFVKNALAKRTRKI